MQTPQKTVWVVVENEDEGHHTSTCVIKVFAEEAAARKFVKDFDDAKALRAAYNDCFMRKFKELRAPHDVLFRRMPLGEERNRKWSAVVDTIDDEARAFADAQFPSLKTEPRGHGNLFDMFFDYAVIEVPFVERA